MTMQFFMDQNVYISATFQSCQQIGISSNRHAWNSTLSKSVKGL